MSLTLKQKLEMTKLSEEGRPEAETGRKLGLPAHRPGCECKGKVPDGNVKRLSSDTRMVRRQNGLTADMQKAFVVWIDDQTVP